MIATIRPHLVFLCTCDGLSTETSLGRAICDRFPSITVYGYCRPLLGFTVAGGHFSECVSHWLALHVDCERVRSLVSMLLTRPKVSSTSAALYLIASSQESAQEKDSVLLNPNVLSHWLDESKFENQDLTALRETFRDVYLLFQKPHMIIDAALIMHWGEVEANELVQWARAEMKKQKPVPMDDKE